MPTAALRLAAAAAAGYLLGTLPAAGAAAGLASRGRVDLATDGSGNPGAANAIALLGPRWGYAVLAADIGKGALASGLGRRLAGGTGAHVGGTASVVGHCHPIWPGRKGGKGVACSVGQCLVTFPAYFPVDLGVAALTSTGRWRSRAFASTAVASVAWVLGGLLWWGRRWPNGWGPPPAAALPLAAAASSAVIIERFVAAERRRSP